MKILNTLLLVGLLSHAVPCQLGVAGEKGGQRAADAIDEPASPGGPLTVRLRRIGAEPFPLEIVIGVTTRDQLRTVRKPQRRVVFANGAESWMYPVEPAMRAPTTVPPDAELMLFFDAAGIVRKWRVQEPPLPRLALRNTPSRQPGYASPVR